MSDAPSTASVQPDPVPPAVTDRRPVPRGVLQITAADSTDVSDYGVYDTSTIEKDMTAVVNASFAVN
jgi:hypothetical protein